MKKLVIEIELRGSMMESDRQGRELYRMLRYLAVSLETMNRYEISRLDVPMIDWNGQCLGRAQVRGR